MIPVKITQLSTNKNPIHLTLDVGWVEKYKTVTGNPIVISDGVKDTLLKKLQMTLAPKQDLHGYDKPWVGGAGKNKLPMRTEFTVNGVKFTPQDDGTYKIQGTATSASWTNSPKTYTLQALGISVGETIAFSTNIRIYGFFLDANGVNTGISFDTSGSTFRTITVPNDAVSVVVYIYGIETLPQVGQTIDTVGWYQLEKGSTATSFEPYSNICPISGWDEVETVVSGKNLLDKALLKDQAGWNQIVLTLQPNTQYTMSTSLQSTAELYIYFYPYAGNPSSTYEVMASHPVTITTGADGLARIQQRRASGSDSFQNHNWQIELGSTATSYEPYQGHTYTTDLPQTVYGGTLDVVSGVLTVTHGYKAFDGSEVWKASTNADRYYLSLDATTFPYKWSSSPDAVSNQYAYYGSAPNSSSVPDGMFYLFRSSSTTTTIREIGVHDSTVGSLANLKARLGDNPFTVCYELATPTTIQCDPQTVSLLAGENVVMGDGDMEITYRVKASA